MSDQQAKQSLGELNQSQLQTGTDVKSLYHQALKKRREKRDAKLQKILEAAQQKPSITNDDVQILVAVSDRTARIYLQELVRQGKLKATANRGRGVAYIAV